MARNTYSASQQDLIVAPATAPGAAAIAIVRLSGPGAIEAADGLFGGRLAGAEAGRMVLGKLGAIDHCLAVCWRAPHSYTGENMVEFHVHGSPAVVAATLEACRAAGARLAQPGEFTRRAFLNGKLDLAQAEAVAALTAAQTDDARRSALTQLQGGLSARLAAARAILVQVAAELEAYIDFADEEVPRPDSERLLARVAEARAVLAELLRTWDRGRRLLKGARVVFAGAPNAGKSSLFNALLGRERAIVTPHAGTTRDTLEATVELAGIPVTYVDTAGLREGAEEIEAAGIARSRAEIEGADLTLFLVDTTSDLEPLREEYRVVAPLPHLLVASKTDLATAIRIDSATSTFRGPGRLAVVAASAVRREGLAALEEAIVTHLGGRAEAGAETVLTSARHFEALSTADALLATAATALAGGISPEYVVIDLAAALSEIDRVTGRQELDEDVLDAIFSTFCLGK